MNEIQALITLKKMPNLGDISIKKLIQTIGSAEGVLKEKKQHLLQIPGIGAHKLKSFENIGILKDVEMELKFIEKENIRVLHFQDNDYPFLLKQCVDSPVLLFTSGNYNLKNRKIVSVVGTRKITKYGIEFCESLIESLKPYNPIIVSGFAYGTDITAHKSALKNQLETLGCLAHGLNQIYPKSHKRYIQEVESNGGFFTDFTSTDKFVPKNFLRRNRIIAGMAETTIVIESAKQGGSMVTAQLALNYNREVFAVPGRTTDQLSAGCNALIKNHQAHILTNVDDIITNLNWDQQKKIEKAPQLNLFENLTPKEEKVYQSLREFGKLHIDALAIYCDLPFYLLSSLLLDMELKNLIRPLPGKFFELI